MHECFCFFVYVWISVNVLFLRSMAAVVIQRHWRKHRRRRRIPLLHDDGGGGKRIGRREKGHGRGGGGGEIKCDARITRNGQRCLDQGYAATVIQVSIVKGSSGLWWSFVIVPLFFVTIHDKCLLYSLCVS